MYFVDLVVVDLVLR